MPYKTMKAWVEADTEHPALGEIVSFVVVATMQHLGGGTMVDIPHVCEMVDACLCIEIVNKQSPHWSYYELLGPTGETYAVNILSDTMPRVFICWYGNASKAFSLDFLERSVIWSPT